MDEASLYQLIAVVGTVGGILLGGATASIAAFWKNRGNSASLEASFKAHAERIDRFHQESLQALLTRDKIARTDESYRMLSSWLYRLEKTIDDVWEGCCSSDAGARSRANFILDEWPWETLRVPPDVAPFQFYWTSRIQDLIRDFSGASADFVAESRIVMESIPDERQDNRALSNIWELRNQLFAKIDLVRSQMRTESQP